jgi:hypothetical protein
LIYYRFRNALVPTGTRSLGFSTRWWSATTFLVGFGQTLKKPFQPALLLGLFHLCWVLSCGHNAISMMTLGSEIL